MGLLGDARLAWGMGLRFVRGRLDQRRLLRRLAARPPLERGRYEIAVYFADPAVNLYQLRQWYAPLADLASRWPVLVLSRSPDAALAMLDESPLPVAYVRRVADLEKVVEEQPLRIVLYVNQNVSNFSMMRYGRRWHVFINHGEGDKVYGITNQFKAYDYALLAGPAARERLGRVLWDYDFDKRAIETGRPQVDHYAGEPPYEPDERTVVLYAPTWEGDRAAAAYGSLATHGEVLVEALLATGRHRVIYRPHPRSGAVDPAYGAAGKRIAALLERANQADPSAHHVHDTGSALGWQLTAADVMVTDVSALVYDRLATGKPLIVTRPVQPGVDIGQGGYLSHADWLDAADAGSIVERVDAVLADDEARARLAEWSRHYFGDTTPGATTSRFRAAFEHLFAEWDRHAALDAAPRRDSASGDD